MPNLSFHEDFNDPRLDLRPSRVGSMVALFEVLTTMDAKSDSHAKMKKIEAEMADMIDQHDLRLLKYSAAGRLFAAREGEQVLPLDADHA